ncbi:hypothetical protein GCM10012289_40970 [Nonomuraea cavernae]|uniref:Tetratricopeptide repeat protein n=2 Tax=Nonomuraea cavernae TaxID=2045107 RepID=A0A917Z1K6_9ACTN|nr:hypothetical protein GCM10012289_40970 [Nonomuraea cavernae]
MRLWVGAGGAAIFSVAVGVAINEGTDGTAWHWGWLAAALVAALGYVGWERWRGRPGPIGRLLVADSKGRPLPVSEVPGWCWGMSESRFAADGEAPHIARAFDAELVDALDDAAAGTGARLIVVQGERLAGSTHALAHAVRGRLPDWRLACFVDDPRAALPDLLGQAAAWLTPKAGVVVWLDAVRPDRLAEFTPSLLAELPPRLVVTATLHTEDVVNADGDPAARLASHVPGLLRACAVHLTLGLLTREERDRIAAEPAYRALRPALADQSADLLIGRLMISLDKVRQALALGTAEQAADRVAVLRAATDWYRAQMPARLTKKALQQLWRGYRLHLGELSPRTRLPAGAFDRALAWALAPGGAARPQLLSLDRIYRPHPLLEIIAAETGRDGWAIGAPLWDYARGHFTPDDLRKLAYTALDQGHPAVAADLLADAPLTDLPAEVSFRIAEALTETGEAIGWYKRVLDTEDADRACRAMFRIGELEAGRQRMPEARHWFERAADSVHPEVAVLAAGKLGQLDRDEGDITGARRWLTRVAESGHPDHGPAGMIELALLEESDGKGWEARRWLRAAFSTEHPDHRPRAMVEFGRMEMEERRYPKAIRWLKDASATGHPRYGVRATLHLARAYYETGQPHHAERLLRTIVDSDDPDMGPAAMVNLGIMLHSSGRVSEAAALWERALATGHPDEVPAAMSNLALVEATWGNLPEARRLYHQVVESGHRNHAPTAMVSLGKLEEEQRPDQARHWLTRAIDTGHREQGPVAMISLAFLELRQGRVAKARALLKRAVATGHPEYAADARRLLRKLGGADAVQ